MASGGIASMAGQVRRHPESGGIRKSGITRVRTGCFTCRKRRKKCDEKRPICENCRKTNIYCEGFPQQVRWGQRPAARSAEKSVAPMATSPRAQNSTVIDLTAGGVQVQDFGQDFAQVASTAVTHRTPATQLPEYDGFNNIPVGDDWTFGIPQFGQEATQDTWQESPDVVYGAVDMLDAPPSDSRLVVSRELGQTPQALGLRNEAYQSFMPTHLPFLIPGVESQIHKRLFCHFTGTMSHLLVTSIGESNQMHSVVVPLAMDDGNVMNTVLCLAGSHLLKVQANDNDPELSIETLRLHHNAVKIQTERIKALKETTSETGLSFSVRNQEIIFATSLLLCLFEICEGTGSDAWTTHLGMAREVVTLASALPESPESDPIIGPVEPITSEIDPFLLEFFLYRDSLATVTVPSAPALKRRFHGLTDLSESQTCVIGVQDGLIDFVTRIAALRTQADASSSQPDGNVVCRAVTIWQDLDRWKPKGFSRERKLIAEFYQWALFIWLYSIVYPNNKSDYKIQDAVTRIAAGMNEIKDGVMACLLFPLFIVGSAAITVEDKAAITSQFKRLREWSSFGNIDLTYGVVEKMWEDHDKGVLGSWDWVRQLERHDMSFLVA